MRFLLKHPVAWINTYLLNWTPYALGRKGGKRRIVRTRAYW